MTRPGDSDIQRSLQQLEALLQEIDHFADSEAAAKTAQIVEGLLEFHGAGLAKVLDCIAEAGEAGQAIMEAIARDEVAGNLLLLHGLHPLDLEARVRQALEKVQPYLATHSGHVELLGVTAEGVVGLRLEGNCHGCPSSRATLKGAIEEAIYAAAPDVNAIEVEGLVEEPPPAPRAGYVPVSQLTVHERPMYPAGCEIGRG